MEFNTDLLSLLKLLKIRNGCPSYPTQRIKYETFNSDFFIITKKGLQCMTGRERLTPYQSEDPSSTIPYNRKREEKWKNDRRQTGNEQLRPIKKTLALPFKPVSPTLSNTGSPISFHRDAER